jgi:hypothetical protein
MLTFDSKRMPASRRWTARMSTHDGRTVDSAGAFLVNELERLDPTLHMPLAAVTWSRDVDLRGDVTIADESASSFTNSTFAAPGGVHANGHQLGRQGCRLPLPASAVDINEDGAAAAPLGDGAFLLHSRSSRAPSKSAGRSTSRSLRA